MRLNTNENRRSALILVVVICLATILVSNTNLQQSDAQFQPERENRRLVVESHNNERHESATRDATSSVSAAGQPQKPPLTALSLMKQAMARMRNLEQADAAMTSQPVRVIDWLEAYSNLSSSISHVNTALSGSLLQMERLPFLENFRNPCWIEELPADTNDVYAQRKHDFEKMQFNVDLIKVKSKFSHRRKSGNPYRMRCLPLVYIIGPQKTGTTDLYNSLLQHPGIIAGLAKEPHWWARSRLKGTTLEEYVDVFDEAAEKIASSVIVSDNGSTYHPYVTIDATPELIWDNWSWKQETANRRGDVRELRHLLPDQIRHVIPQARVIAMLREPIQRLWSDYHYFGNFEKSPQDFDARVAKGLRWLERCMGKVKTEAHRKHCMYDPLVEYGGKYGRSWNPVSRMRMSMYSELLIDWFIAFPRDQILILKMEDYANDRITVINKIIEFLGLDPLCHAAAAQIREQQIANTVPVDTYRRSGKILAKTKRKLKQFYNPLNMKLANLTENDSFLTWNL